MVLKPRLFKYEYQRGWTSPRLDPNITFSEGEKGVLGKFTEVWDYPDLDLDTVAPEDIIVFGKQADYFDSSLRYGFSEIPNHRFQKYLLQNINARVTAQQTESFEWADPTHLIVGGSMGLYLFKEGTFHFKPMYPEYKNGTVKKKHYLCDFLIHTNQTDLSKYVIDIDL